MGFSHGSVFVGKCSPWAASGHSNICVDRFEGRFYTKIYAELCFRTFEHLYGDSSTFLQGTVAPPHWWATWLQYSCFSSTVRFCQTRAEWIMDRVCDPLLGIGRGLTSCTIRPTGSKHPAHFYVTPVLCGLCQSVWLWAEAGNEVLEKYNKIK